MKKSDVVLGLIVISIFMQGSAMIDKSFVIDAQNNVVMHESRGLQRMNEGDYYTAIQEFKIAIALNPNSAAAGSFYNNLGLVYIKINRPDWAQTCFHRAIKLNPNFLSFYKNLAWAYKLNRRTSFGIKKYKVTLELDSDNAQSYLMLGLLYLQMGNETAAVKNLSKFVQIEPDLMITRDVRKLLNSIK